MIHFEYPELALLAIPLGLAYRRWGRARGVTGWLRLAILAVLLLALTGPGLNLGGKGVDIIVLADRSRSLSAEDHSHIRELIENLQRNRGPGDRVGVVGFGGTAQIEQKPSESKILSEYTKEVSPDGTDLHQAVMRALSLVDPDRPTRILALTDGEANGRSPLSAARRAREQGVPIDYRLFERLDIGDVAVESVLLPEQVAPREPFQFSVRIYADAESHGRVRIVRDGKRIAVRETDLHTGMNRLHFRDVLETGGLSAYTVELDVNGDPLQQNNRGEGVVRVQAGPRLLVLNADGHEDNLVRALQAGRLPVDVAAAEAHPLTQDALDPYRAVVIENTPAGDLGRLKMQRLAQFVEDLGGGLMLTGGKRSYGTGGYFKSPLDEVLPVSMELREEHRKNRVALAIALDRSGSMDVSVRGNVSKMDLANLGTAECVRLLSAMDMVSVIAVDSSPHVVQPLTSVADPEPIAQKALQIESAGGGIFVYEALVAAGEELMKAEDDRTRHIILFSDAADSERPGKYRSLVQQYREAGISVSVIGLGTRSDPDARLLEEIASLGGGNILFTDDPQELPRLFTQDTMSVARNTFLTAGDEYPQGFPGRLLPDIRLLGGFEPRGFPPVGGYNLTYLKPDATAGVVSQDEYSAPWSAFWYRGLGRVAALTVEVDGPFSGPFARWEHYEDFLITHARWLTGGGSTNAAFVDVERDGQDAVVTVELDPERDSGGTPPRLIVVPPGRERQPPVEPDLVWTGAHTLQGRFRMDRLGTYRTLVKTGDRTFTRGPAVSLPYSPEYVPRVGLPSGQETLEEMASLSGGTARTDILELFADPPRSPRTRPLLPWLMMLGIGLLVIEIAGRRLSLWRRLGDPAARTEPSAAGVRRRRLSPAAALSRAVSSLRPRRSTAVSEKTAGRDEPHDHTAREDRPDSRQAVSHVFQQAKHRARRRSE